MKITRIMQLKEGDVLNIKARNGQTMSLQFKVIKICKPDDPKNPPVAVIKGAEEFYITDEDIAGYYSTFIKEATERKKILDCLYQERLNLWNNSSSFKFGFEHAIDIIKKCCDDN